MSIDLNLIVIIASALLCMAGALIAIRTMLYGHSTENTNSVIKVDDTRPSVKHTVESLSTIDISITNPGDIIVVTESNKEYIVKKDGIHNLLSGMPVIYSNNPALYDKITSSAHIERYSSYQHLPKPGAKDIIYQIDDDSMYMYATYSNCGAYKKLPYDEVSIVVMCALEYGIYGNSESDQDVFTVAMSNIAHARTFPECEACDANKPE